MKLGEIYRFMDVEGSGIRKQQLATGLLALGIGLSDLELDEVWEKMDASNAGVVDYGTFLEFVSKAHVSPHFTVVGTTVKILVEDWQRSMLKKDEARLANRRQEVQQQLQVIEKRRMLVETQQKQMEEDSVKNTKVTEYLKEEYLRLEKESAVINSRLGQLEDEFEAMDAELPEPVMPDTVEQKMADVPKKRNRRKTNMSMTNIKN